MSYLVFRRRTLSTLCAEGTPDNQQSSFFAASTGRDHNL